MPTGPTAANGTAAATSPADYVAANAAAAGGCLLATRGPAASAVRGSADVAVDVFVAAKLAATRRDAAAAADDVAASAADAAAAAAAAS